MWVWCSSKCWKCSTCQSVTWNSCWNFISSSFLKSLLPLHHVALGRAGLNDEEWLRQWKCYCRSFKSTKAFGSAPTVSHCGCGEWEWAGGWRRPPSISQKMCGKKNWLHKQILHTQVISWLIAADINGIDIQQGPRNLYLSAFHLQKTTLGNKALNEAMWRQQMKPHSVFRFTLSCCLVVWCVCFPPCVETPHSKQLKMSIWWAVWVLLL